MNTQYQLALQALDQLDHSIYAVGRLFDAYPQYEALKQIRHEIRFLAAEIRVNSLVTELELENSAN